MWLIESFWLLNFHSDLLLILLMHILVAKLPNSSPWKNPAYSLIFTSWVISLMKSPLSTCRAKFIILYVKYTLLLECLKNISHTEMLYLALILWSESRIVFTYVLCHLETCLRQLWLPAFFVYLMNFTKCDQIVWEKNILPLICVFSNKEMEGKGSCHKIAVKEKV